MKELDKPFVLDVRSKIVVEGDFILFTEDNTNYCRKVWGVRIIDGNYEVKVMGDKGGWKRNFYKLAED